MPKKSRTNLNVTHNKKKYHPNIMQNLWNLGKDVDLDISKTNFMIIANQPKYFFYSVETVVETVVVSCLFLVCFIHKPK